MKDTLPMFDETEDELRKPPSGRLPDGYLVDGRYVVDGFLAEGGFASVYRAHHHQIERKVALKILELRAGPDKSEDFAQRFLQEAKIAARITHPSVVDVFDFGVLSDGRAYLAMDLLEGHDLEYELNNFGPMSADRIVPMIRACLAALQEGHQQGIVHKDLKPSNLFLVNAGTDSERLVILDFGIARVFHDPGARVTREGGFSGTPAYLAPEYIRYQEVSPAVDVYQMGLILVEALTGQPAVQAESSLGYLLAHCTQPIVLPKVLHDTKLGTVCAKALAKEPENRWANAGEFLVALEGIAAGDLYDTEPIAPVVEKRPPTSEDAKTLQFIDVTVEDLSALRTEVDIPAVVPARGTVGEPAPGNDTGPDPVVASVEQDPESAADPRSNAMLAVVAFALLAAVVLAAWWVADYRTPKRVSDEGQGGELGGGVPAIETEQVEAVLAEPETIAPDEELVTDAGVESVGETGATDDAVGVQTEGAGAASPQAAKPEPREQPRRRPVARKRPADPEQAKPSADEPTADKQSKEPSSEPRKPGARAKDSQPMLLSP